jgi:hypothetical protein
MFQRETFHVSITTVFTILIEGTLSLILFLKRIFAYYRSVSYGQQITHNIVTDAVSSVSEVKENEAPHPASFVSIGTLINKSEKEYEDVREMRHTIMYAGTPRVLVYRMPTAEFDTILTHIPYGELVMVLEPQGRFYKVTWGTHTGWVLKEMLVDRAAYVYPDFVMQGHNMADDENTTKVRMLIGDPFGLSHSEYALQAGEYVLYKLWRRGIHITWPDVRPRTPGLWHVILRGVPAVHIGVFPKVGSIMEYIDQNEIGHVAYVEAVYPQDSVTISEVNMPDSGIYNERTLEKNEWRECKPVFLTVAAL